MSGPALSPICTRRVPDRAERNPLRVAAARSTSVGWPQRKSSTMSKPAAPPACENASATSTSGSPRRIVASAPSSGNSARRFSFRPAATTRPAPRCFAIWIASCPATPVAPRINTLSPAAKRAEVINGSHEERPGFGRAAATALSTPSGTGQQNDRGTAVRWHIEPFGGRLMPKNTRVPSSSLPTPSTPQITGNCCGLA